MDHDYPCKLDIAVTRKLRCGDYLGAWDALHELAEAILDRRIPIIRARPKLEVSLLSVLKHLVDAEAYLAVDALLARRAILERLRKPESLEPVIDEFLALVHDVLGPWRFHDYLGVKRQALGAYLETIAQKRLDDPSTARGTVDEVFIDLLQAARETGIWELPDGPTWTRALARRVRDKAGNRNRRRRRRARRVASADVLDAPVPPQRESIPWIGSQQEATLYFKEILDQLSTQERHVCELKAQGFTGKEIAAALGIPLRTVERMQQCIRVLLKRL